MASPVTEVRRAHAAAPVRLDLAGGWTDVAPFATREGGAVVAAAISLYEFVRQRKERAAATAPAASATSAGDNKK
jgi:galactokinase/mevalonate kinase-like predicted kinase